MEHFNNLLQFIAGAKGTISILNARSSQAPAARRLLPPLLQPVIYVKQKELTAGCIRVGYIEVIISLSGVHTLVLLPSSVIYSSSLRIVNAYSVRMRDN